MEWLRLSPDEWTAVRLSIKVSTWATVVSLPFGILVAHVLARREFPGKAVLNGLVHLPLILPPVVTGYLLLLTFGRRGPVGRLPRRSISASSSPSAGPARRSPAASWRFPLMVRAIRLSIEAVDRRLEAAAGTLGASPLWVFATVTLPLILPGVIAGMILTFAKAMGEFGATITFVSNIPGETQTLPSAIYTFTQVPGGRARGAAADAGLDRDRHGGAGRVGGVRAAGQPAHGPRMTLAVDGPAAARELHARRRLRERRPADRAVRARRARARPRSST